MTRPTSMLPRPAMRSSRSPSVEQLRERALDAAGIQERQHPSSTRNSASAASRSDRLNDMRGCGRLSAAERASAPLAGVLQVLEELAVGRHDQHVAVLAERALVGLQAAVEGVELGVLANRPARRCCAACASPSPRIRSASRSASAMISVRLRSASARMRTRLALPSARRLVRDLARSSASCSRRPRRSRPRAGRCAARARR